MSMNINEFHTQNQLWQIIEIFTHMFIKISSQYHILSFLLSIFEHRSQVFDKTFHWINRSHFVFFNIVTVMIV